MARQVDPEDEILFGCDVSANELTAGLVDGALSAIFAQINHNNYTVKRITFKPCFKAYRMDAYGQK